MSKIVQWKRGNTTATSTYTGPEGEIVVNTDTWSMYVHDGTTQGGHLVQANIAPGDLTIDGNITANFFLGNGFYLTGITSGSANLGNIEIVDQTISGLTPDQNIILSASGLGQIQLDSILTSTSSASFGNGLVNANSFISLGNSGVYGYNFAATANINLSGITGMFHLEQTSSDPNVSAIFIKHNAVPQIVFLSNRTTDLYGNLVISPDFTSFGDFPNAYVQVYGNINSYSQIVHQNIYDGPLASTDLVLTSNDGTDSTFFVDLGIASNSYNYPGYGVIKPHDAYLLAVGENITGPGASDGGNLILGSTTGKIKFFSGAPEDANVIAEISPEGFIPAANVTYSLGSVTNQWRDLWVSNNTIYLGGSALSVDSNGDLTVNGNIISGSGGYTVQYEVGTFEANVAPGFGEIQFANFEGANSDPTTAQKLFINEAALNEQNLGTVLQQWTTNSYRGTLSLNNGVDQATFNISNGGLYFEPEVYRGFSAGLNQIWGDDCSINQLIITNATAPKFYNTDFLLEDDVFHATNLATGNTHVMLNVYGSSQYRPIDPSYLWSLFTSFVDNVLYDGATLRTDPGDMKTQFYNNTGNFRDQIPTQDYYQYFRFTQSSNADYFGTAPTTTNGSGIDATVRIRVNANNTYTVLGTANPGSGYIGGETLTVLGTDLGGATPANDLTILIDSVDGDGVITQISYLNGDGVYPWPSNYISDGSDDQYDSGNYINTNLAAEISYGNGDTQIESAAFGGGDYCVMYNQSIFCMIATGSNISDLFYSGNLGSDGAGLIRWTGLRSTQAITANNSAQYAYFDSEYLDGTLTIANGVTYNMTLDSAGIDLDKFYAYYNNATNRYHFGSSEDWYLESQQNLYVQSYNDMFIQTAVNQRSIGIGGPNININASAGSPGQREINAQAGNGGSVNVNGGDAGGSDNIDSLGNNGGSVNINGGMGSGASSGGSVYINGGQTESPVGIAGNIDIGTFAGPNGNGRVSISTNNGTTHTWVFTADGSTIFPTLSVPRGDTTSGNLTGTTIKIGDGSDEAIITTPDGDPAGGQSSQRLVINPGKGADNTAGEGGDIYLWAGRGGSGDFANAVSGGSGGDIKIRGGQGGGTDGAGGYIRMEAGDGASGGGQAGYVEITGGVGQTSGGGYVEITGGQGISGGDITLTAGTGTAGPGGDVNITGGTSSNGLPEYGNVYVNSGASTWTFDNTGRLTVPGEGVIRSIDDTIILQSYDTTGNINKGLRVGTNGGLYLEHGSDPAWLSFTNDSGDAEIGAAPGATGTGNAGYNLFLFGGPADTSAYGTGAGGNINLNAGLGASNDGGGGGPGGSVNITAGDSYDPAGHAGNVTINAGSNTWNFDYTGGLTFPRDAVANTDPILSINGGTNPSIVSSDASLMGPANLSIVSNYARFSGYSGSAVQIYADDGSILGDTSLVLTANAANAGSTSSWTFDSTGNLGLPGGGIIYGNPYTPSGAPGNTITLQPAGSGTITDQRLLVYPTAGDGDHIHLTSGNLYQTELFLGSDNLYVKLSSTGDVVVNSNDNTGNTAQWTFGTDGNLTLPTNSASINYANGSPYGGSGSSNYGNSNVVTLLASFGSNTITTTGNITGANIVATANLLISGYGKFAGTFDESIGSNQGVVLGYAGGTPRVLFGTGNTQQTFEIDNDGGTLRFYQPGSTKASLTSTGDFSASGNVSANYFIGNGALLTGISAGAGNYGNTNVASYLGSYGSNTIVTTGNITAGNVSTSGNITFSNNNSTILFNTGAYISANGAGISREGSIVLSPAATGTFPGVVIGGAGRLLAPNGGVFQIFNSADVTFQVTTKVTAATTATSTTSGALVVTGGVGVGGNIYVGGNATTGVGALVSGVTNTLLSNTVAGFTGNVNSYTQVTFQNKNTGADATADYILTADNGSDTVNYSDFGIINSGYDNATPTNSLGNIVYAADTYLYAQGNASATSQSGGNLAIGTTTTGKTVKIFAGGANASSIIATVSNTGVAVTGNISVTGNITGSTPNVQLVAGNYTSTFDNAGMVTVPNVTVTGNVTASGTSAFYAPNRPAFRVYGNTSTVFASGTITNQAIDYNQGSYYTNSTGLFTAPVAGLYHCYATVRVATNNGLNQVVIQKNSSTSGANVIAFWETDTNTGTAVHFSMTGYARCVVGDTIRLQVLSGNVNFDTNDSWGVTYIG